MPLSNQYLVKGIDFSVLAQFSSGELNSLVDQANIAADKGLILRTTDTALNVPDTPDTVTYPDFKNHLWLRLPFNNTYDPKLYCYVPAPTDDWVSLIVDITAIETIANDAATDATNAIAIANAATVTANNAAAIANTATNNASTATTIANNALAASQTAQTNSNNALSAANSAVSLGLVLFQSATQNLTNNAVDEILVAHGLGATPLLIRPVIVCINADLGYSAGDEIPIEAVRRDDGAIFWIYGADAVNVWIKIGVTNNSAPRLTIIHKTTLAVAFTYADRTKWAVKLYAFGRS